MSDSSRLCPSCRGLTSAKQGRCSHCGFAFEPMASCPVCRRWTGQHKLRIRKVGRERTLGIPFVASISYNEVDDIVLSGLCTGCMRSISNGRFLAWLLTLVPASALFVIAGPKHSIHLWIAAGFVAMATFAFVFYGPFDALLWGSRVLRRVGAPRVGRWEVPANYAMMITRAVIGAVVLFVVAAVAAT